MIPAAMTPSSGDKHSRNPNPQPQVPAANTRSFSHDTPRESSRGARETELRPIHQRNDSSRQMDSHLEPEIYEEPQSSRRRAAPDLQASDAPRWRVSSLDCGS